MSMFNNNDYLDIIIENKEELYYGLLNEQVMHEIYFGKNNELLEAERLIGKIRKLVTNKKTNMKKINEMDDVLAFNRIIKKLFGFKAFALIIEPSIYINAYTIPISDNFNKLYNGKHLRATNKGFKYDGTLSAFVCIYSSFFNDNMYTDNEILAVILHEIGHNFQISLKSNPPSSKAAKDVADLLKLLSSFILIILPSIIESGVTSNNVNNVVNEFSKKNKNLTESVSKLNGIVWRIKNTLVNIATVFNAFCPIFKFALALGNAIMDVPYNLISKMFFVNNENTADNFATMYGYGPSLSSALKKMDTASKPNTVMSNIKGNKFLGNLYDVINLPITILNSISNEHPTTVSRINDNIKMLQIDLAKENIDPEMKKELISHIEQMQHSLDDYLYNIEKINRNDTASRIFYLALFKICGGDIKNIATRDIEDLDKDYNNAFKKAKKE